MAIIRPTISLIALACWCALASVASADTLSPTANESEESISSELQRFSRLLDSDHFSERRQASQKLSAAGVKAFPLLEKAALGSSREASARAMNIIQQQFATGDAETRSQAETFLKRIAESDNDFAARRADEALHPQAEPDQFQPLFGRAMPANRAAIQAAQFQQMRIQIANQQPQLRRQVNIRNANGVKTTTVIEGSKKVKITEQQNSVEVEVTEKKDGKETTEKYAAKSVDELKKKHPAGYKLYNENSQGGGALQIQGAGNIQIQIGGGNQALPPQIRMPNLEKFRKLQEAQREEKDDS